MPTTVHTDAAEPAGWRANHIEETIRSITRLHDEHHQNATPLQRAVDRITALLGRPPFIGVLTIIAAGWISLNLLAAALGYRPIDPPPFSGLGGAVSLVSLYMVVLILATQQREYQLAQLRVNDGKRSEAARLAEIEVIAAKAARQVTAAASAARSAPSAAARHSPSSWSLDPGNVTASFECCLDAHP
jgi:uncharacterized membrane protein